MTEALVYAGLWQRFGIPGYRVPGVDARWIRRLRVLQAGDAVRGGEVDG